MCSFGFIVQKNSDVSTIKVILEPTTFSSEHNEHFYISETSVRFTALFAPLLNHSAIDTALALTCKDFLSLIYSHPTVGQPLPPEALKGCVYISKHLLVSSVLEQETESQPPLSR